MKEEKKTQKLLRSYLRWPMIPAVLSILAACCAFFFDRRAGMAVAVFALITFAFCLRLLFSARKNVMKAVVNFAVATDELQKRLSDDMDVPYAFVDRGGMILWQNRAMKTLLKEQKKNPKNVEEMFPEFSLAELMKIGETEDYHLSMGGLRYRVRFTRTGEATDRIFAMYLYDETELITLRDQINSDRLVAGLIYLDNYEEAMESVEEVRRSLLTAMIDRKIVRHFDGMQAIIRKLEKDKYFMVLQKKHLQTLEERQFDILEQVKMVNIGNEMRVTLSIGIGDGGDDYAECAELARQAMDMALGRGGDQAVIKRPESVQYYGGKTNSKEKTTRVKARVKAHAFRELIENKDRLFIMGHKRMDIDCLGAAIGIWRIAVTLDKKAHIVVSDQVAAVKPMLKRFQGGEYPPDLFISEDTAMELLDENSVLVVVDTNNPVVVKARIVRASTNAVLTPSNPTWGFTIMDGDTWTVKGSSNTDSITVTTAHTDQPDGSTHDVEVLAEVSFDSLT